MRRLVARGRRLYWGSGIAADVPALAWYLLAACAPLALGVVALATIVLGDAGDAQAATERVGRILGPELQDQVAALVLRTSHDSPLTLAVAVASMVWAGAGATGVLERVQSRLLDAPPRGAVVRKLHHLALGAMMAGLITGLTVAGVEAADVGASLGIEVPGWVSALGGTAGIVLICTLLYRYATTVRLPWRAALLGALPAAVVLRLTPVAAGLFMHAVAGRSPVELFFLLGGLLFACFAIAQGLLIGCGVAAGQPNDVMATATAKPSDVHSPVSRPPRS